VKRKKIPHCDGFTLVETLIASAILAIGILLTATMIARSTIQDSRSYYMSRASMIMEEFIENATRSQYSPNEFSNMTNTLITTTIDGIEYKMTCNIANGIPLNNNTKEMSCAITWNNKGIQASTNYVYVFSKKY
jgi:prepilin-type N-terminal cleavage/methylation domain-containing protein